MNLVFRVIWSDVRNAYVVVSEFAKSKVKGCSSKKRIIAAGVLATVLAGGINMQLVYADGTGATAWGKATVANGDYATAWGDDSEANGEYSTAWNEGKALAYNSTAWGSSFAEGAYSTAWGGSSAYGDSSTAWGDSAAYGELATSWGGSYAYGYNSTAWGINAEAYGKYSTAWGYWTEAGVYDWNEEKSISGDYATAFGYKTKALEKGSTAWGEETQATEEYATAWGYKTRATNIYSTAFGDGSLASGYAATAFGSSKATGYYATAWGGWSKAIGNKSTAWGDYGVALGYLSTAFGEESEAYGSRATAWGECSRAFGDISTAFGNKSIAGGYNSLAVLGGITGVETDDTYEENGYELSVYEGGENSAAIGYKAWAKTDDSVALGSGSVADRVSGMAGYDAATGKASTSDSVAWVATDNAIAVGYMDPDGEKWSVTRQITGLAAGTEDTDAVNVAQLKSVTKLVTTVEGEVDSLKTDMGKVKDDITGIKTNISGLSDRLTAVEATAGKHSTVSAGDNLEVKVTNTDGVNDYKVSMKKQIALENIDLTDAAGNSMSLSGIGLTVGDTNVDKDGIKIGGKDGSGLSKDALEVDGKTYIDGKGLNANNNKISNVAAGEADTDAVNMSQLNVVDQKVDQTAASVDNLSGKVNKLGTRLNKVGAGAAALAALHPLDFDPEDKLAFSAGVGHYGGENAAALGAFYRPTEKIMFSVGGTMGNGENMVNAGVTFALDRSNGVGTSRTAMARKIVEMDAKIAQLTALVEKLGTEKAALEKEKEQNAAASK